MLHSPATANAVSQAWSQWYMTSQEAGPVFTVLQSLKGSRGSSVQVLSYFHWLVNFGQVT